MLVVDVLAGGPARQHIHHTHFSVSPQIIIAAILVLTVLLLLATHLATR